ncbi:Hpt domain-containing protein [Duganella hordei]|uniref:Hpt domain-containing protein n=1 Tax=Duganella hordei TaxID=2865934 RepID=UPI0030E83D15
MSAAYLAIDPRVLWRAAGGDRLSFRALSQTFIDVAPERLAVLRQALGGGRPAEIRAASHALKGMTLLVGADALSALLQSLEIQAHAGLPLPPVTQLEALFSQVMREVARSLLDYDGAGGTE